MISEQAEGRGELSDPIKEVRIDASGALEST